MKMKDMPFFKFDAADYLTGKIQLMPMENQGVFVNLLARIWINNGSILEDEFLPRLLGCSETQLKATLSLGFRLGIIEQCDDGYLSVKFLKEQITQRFNFLEKQRGNGSKGGRPKNPTKPKKKEECRKKSVESREDIKEVNQEKKTPPKKFTPPTIEEVESYCQERGGVVDPQRWRDYYESNGWKVGRNAMRDWRAAVRTWERNETGVASKPTGKLEL